jgi:hypothetical protein
MGCRKLCSMMCKCRYGRELFRGFIFIVGAIIRGVASSSPGDTGKGGGSCSMESECEGLGGLSGDCQTHRTRQKSTHAIN